MIKIILLMNLVFFVLTTVMSSKEEPFTLKDKDRLIRVEARLTEMVIN